jgi:hypothetical protein
MSAASRLRAGAVLLAGGALAAVAVHDAASRLQSPLSGTAPDCDVALTPAPRSAAPVVRPGATVPRAPILFVENVGQSELPGRFVADVAHGRVAFREDGFMVQFVEQAPAESEVLRDESTPEPEREVRGLNLGFTFEGALACAMLRGEQRLPTHVNVYDGDDPADWHEDIPAFAALRCADVYPGISVLYHDADATLEYDVLVEPDADLSSVVLRCDGADGVSVANDGSLTLATALGTWRLPPPVTYVDHGKDRHSVACRYRNLGGNRFGFEAEGWDRRSTLVIDPSIAYATFLGGTALGDTAVAVAVDSSGCPFVGGKGGGTGFPTTPGAFLTSSPAGSAYVAKFTADGSALIYSTYLSKTSYTAGLAVTSDGEAIVQCATSNSSFPTTAGAWDTTYNGISPVAEIAVAKLDAAGGHLVFSTFIGGTEVDSPADMALSPDGSIYLTGWTKSPDFPTTPGAFWESGAGKNVFVTRLAADGTSLVWSTLLGSPTFDEEAFGLAVDAAGSPVVVGRCFAFPVTPGAFDATYNGGGWDAFVARFDASGSHLAFSTFLGGDGVDQASDVRVSTDGSVYVVGRTDSFDFPTTPGVVQPFPKGFGDGFISHLSADGSTLLHSTYLGSSLGDEIYAVGLNPQGNIVIADAIDNPLYVTPDAPTSITDASMLHVLDSTMSELLFGCDFGDGQVNDMALDSDGLVYLAGQTGSSTLATPGAFDTSLAGTYDAFVLKFDLSPWDDLGQGLAGTAGLVPHLSGTGPLQPGSAGALSLTQARALSPVTLVIGLQTLDAPFKGGTLIPAPLLLLPWATDAGGSAALPWVSWPAGLPAGTDLVFQAWVVDPLAPKGLAASNGLLAVTPVPEG